MQTITIINPNVKFYIRMICQEMELKKPSRLRGLSKEGGNLFLIVLRELHFTVAYEVSSFNQLVAEPNNQEQRDTNIRCRYAAPVNGIFKERFVVLAQSDNQTQNECEDRPQWEET